MNTTTTTPLPVSPAPAPSQPGPGMLLGLVGVAIFALSLPMNRIAAQSFDPVWVGLVRAALATITAGVVVVVTRSPVPPRTLWPQLLLAATCVVFGFPLLTSVAMAKTTASAGALICALLPLSTVIAATILGQQRPGKLFWACAVLGAAIVTGFTLSRGSYTPGVADIYLILAVICAGFGYAWGGIVAQQIGGWQSICWVMLLAAPITLPVAIGWVSAFPQASAPLSAWLAVIYLAAGSQLIGFFFFYGGMAIGGVSRVSQVQLLQLFITLGFSSMFLDEKIDSGFWLTAALTVAILGVARFAPVNRAAQPE